MIKQEMFSTDWIVWIDADILIMNHDFDVYSLLKSKKRDMYVSTDFNGLCTGFFILRNCEWSRNLLDAWMFLGPLKGDWYIEFDQMRKPGEQNTFKCMYKYFSGVKERVDLIPEEVVSNPRTVVNNVPFAHHYWCNGLNKDVIKKIHSFQRKGWSPECI